MSNGATQEMDLVKWLAAMQAASEKRKVPDPGCGYCEDSGWIHYARHPHGYVVELMGREISISDNSQNKLGPVRCDNPRCKVARDFKSSGGFRPFRDHRGNRRRQPRFDDLVRRLGYEMITMDAVRDDRDRRQGNE